MTALGGEISRRPAESTPYQHRDVEWVVNVQSHQRDPTEDDAHVAWARDLFDALTPHATGGAYVDFISHDENRQRVHDAYERLAAIKAERDPENAFHLNQNVRPAVRSSVGVLVDSVAVRPGRDASFGTSFRTVKAIGGDPSRCPSAREAALPPVSLRNA